MGPGGGLGVTVSGQVRGPGIICGLSRIPSDGFGTILRVPSVSGASFFGIWRWGQNWFFRIYVSSFALYSTCVAFIF